MVLRVKLLYMKQLTALRTATSSRSFSILSSNSWWKCAQAGIEQDRSGLVEIQTGISGRLGVQTNYFKSLISNLKEKKGFFWRHQFQGFDSDFFRIKGPYCKLHRLALT